MTPHHVPSNPLIFLRNRSGRASTQRTPAPPRSRPTNRAALRLHALSLAIALALGVPALRAATITVTTPDDAATTSTCTLRQAVNAINSGTIDSPANIKTGACANTGVAFGSGDTINFATNVTSVALDGADNGELDIVSGHDLSIVGSGMGGVTISLASGTASVIGTAQVEIGANLTLTGLTLTRGNAGTYSGGGIHFTTPPNNASALSLTLTNCIVSGNSAAVGGGIAVNGYSPQPGLTLNNSVVSNNHAGYWGGGIYAAGTLTMSHSTLSGNIATMSSGGVNVISSLTMTDSVVSGNNASNGYGGGVYGHGPMQLTNSIVSNNTAGKEGAGLLVAGSITLMDSTVSGNTTTHVGGGIKAQSATLTNSTVSGNTASYGSAVVSGSIRLYNSTVSANTSMVANAASTALLVGWGCASAPCGNSFVLDSSIVSRNSGTYDVMSFHSYAPSGGSNLLGKLANTITTSSLTHPASGNPMLGALADNGCAVQAGATSAAQCVPTMALQPGSPAVDAGSNPLGLITDERGSGFARVNGAAADIGAFESVGSAQSATTMPAPASSLWSRLGLMIGLGLAASGALRSRPRPCKPDIRT
jgi:hypothetical protein